MSALVELLAPGRRDRLRAVREVPPSPAAAFALRRVLFTDGDAEVRAAAARRLADLGGGGGDGGAGAPDGTLEAWLLDALGDGSPLVRDAILRALARVGTSASVPALRALAERDGMWWVRRGAIYALGAVAGATELPALMRTLADPFWRVRHAAVKVLAVLGARDPAVRAEVTAAAPPALQRPTSPAEPPGEQLGFASALTFLRAAWGPVAIEAPARAASASRLPPELLDPDPAVVTARLEAGTFDPLALVELLCDPHVPLRALAAHRIAAAGDLAALEAALDWLEEPRIPHVADTVHELLDGLGDPAAVLAARTLARHDRPGAARWAIEWVVATRSETLFDAALERARRGDAVVRRAALRLASAEELAEWAAADPDLVDAIAVELHERRASVAAHDALLALDGAAHPRTRALQVDARARRGEWAAVQAALSDPHHGPRAVAARWWVRHERDVAAISPSIAALAADLDPSVREAALTPETAVAALADVDPWVRRAAMRMLAAAYADHPELLAEVAVAARAALVDADPLLRAHACRLPLADDATLALVLERLADRSPAARAAAYDAIERLPQADARIRTLLDGGSLGSLARAAAYSWLARSLDEDAAALARTALEAEPDPRIRSLLAAVAELPSAAAAAVAAASTPEPAADAPADSADSTSLDSDDDAPSPAPRIESSVERLADAPAPPPSTRERRPFGRAGFDVAPFAVSGAYDLSPHTLHAAEVAGVDLYFWEPGYDALGRFLRVRERRDRTRVITGSYHADARSIRIDVDRALRVLRRETLDAFLLFWTRSPSRVDAAAFAVLDDLRRAGKVRAIGFSTHHRTLAREAIQASPWDVVMIRHSAAHPGIEHDLLPAARALGTAVVTFSALTYGRMISGPNAPSPADCYRYSLSQPGVTACISAPRRRDELVENLAVLDDPHLSPAQLAALREHGAHVHAESARFNTLIRQPTRDAAAAARELLAAELPPADALPSSAAASPRLPHPGTSRRSRARLGTPSRRSRS